MSKRLRWFRGASLVAGMMLVSGQAGAEVLATCGASSGKAHYDWPSAKWSDDRISGGSFTFTLDSKSNGNVLFKDARGGTVDAAADGAMILLTYMGPGLREFAMVVIYPWDERITETYSVSAGIGGRRQLKWTVNRSGESSGTPKVGAFVASCQ